MEDHLLVSGGQAAQHWQHPDALGLGYLTEFLGLRVDVDTGHELNHGLDMGERFIKISCPYLVCKAALQKVSHVVMVGAPGALDLLHVAVNTNTDGVIRK